jgi:rubrerythrin
MDPKAYNEILAGAIEREIEAYDFYQQVSEKVQDPYLKDLFHGFAEEELKHRQILQGFQDRTEAAIHFAQVPDFHVAETVQEPDGALSIRMKPSDAIALAMKKEEAAMRHYSQMAEACTDPAQQKVFLELAAMERGHKNKMEKAFVDIGYPEVW